MKKQPTYLYISILLGTAVAQPTFAAPIHAVIGLDNSQIVADSQHLSLTPNPGTLIPLEDDFSPITHLQNGLNKNWFDEIGKKVRVEHKQRDLNYTGILAKIEQSSRSFILTSHDRPTTLPLDDFYLIPLEQTDNNKAATRSYPVSYQTDQLSWTPQLSLIFENDNVVVSQQALLHNNSSASIEIQDSLLHYSRSSTPQRFKAERSSLVMSDMQQEVSYQDNEVSYSLGHNLLSIAPYSNTLYPLPSSNSKIDKQTHTANFYTHNNSSGKIDLSFYNTVSFTLKKEGLPGEYNTFWKRENLLIPGNTVMLNTVRTGYPLNVITNKSQDITGYLTLENASSQKLPSTQVWQLTIENHSNKIQNYSVEQSTNGIIEVLEGDDLTKVNANSLRIAGKIKANSKKALTYKLELKN
jgi:hypothetical protein